MKNAFIKVKLMAVFAGLQYWMCTPGCLSIRVEKYNHIVDLIMMECHVRVCDSITRIAFLQHITPMWPRLGAKLVYVCV